MSSPRKTEVSDDEVRQWYGLAVAISRDYFLQGADHDDVVQEALIGLVKGLQDYRPEFGTTKRTFLGLTIHRQVITAVKAAQRGKHQPLTFAGRIGVGEDGREAPLVELAPDPRGSVEDIIEHREDLRRLAAAVADLTDYERDALLGHMAGETYTCMAERLARSPKSIDNGIQRTRRKLTERLAA